MQMNKQQPQTNIILMAAVHATTGAIGNKNKLLYNIPEDMDFFKRTTMGQQVVVGRLTWESIPKGLSGRDVYVLTSQPELVKEGKHVTACTSVHGVLSKLDLSKPVFVIGGAEVYKQFLPHATKMILSTVHREVGEYDTTFPEIKDGDWSRVNGRTLTEEGDVVVHLLIREDPK